MGKFKRKCHGSSHRWPYFHLQGQRKFPGGWNPSANTCFCCRDPSLFVPKSEHLGSQAFRARGTPATIAAVVSKFMNHEFFKGKFIWTLDM